MQNIGYLDFRHTCFIFQTNLLVCLFAQDVPHFAVCYKNQDLEPGYPEGIEPGWVAVPDYASGYLYYWNQLTNEVRWTPPGSPDLDSLPADDSISDQTEQIIQVREVWNIAFQSTLSLLNSNKTVFWPDCLHHREIPVTITICFC